MTFRMEENSAKKNVSLRTDWKTREKTGQTSRHHHRSGRLIISQICHKRSVISNIFFSKIDASITFYLYMCSCFFTKEFSSTHHTLIFCPFYIRQSYVHHSVHEATVRGQVEPLSPVTYLLHWQWHTRMLQTLSCRDKISSDSVILLMSSIHSSKQFRS